MRTTIALDDALIAKAQALTSLQEKSVLVHQALKALIVLGDEREVERVAVNGAWAAFAAA